MTRREHGTPKLLRKKYLPVLQKVIFLGTGSKGITTESNKPIRVRI